MLPRPLHGQPCGWEQHQFRPTGLQLLLLLPPPPAAARFLRLLLKRFLVVVLEYALQRSSVSLGGCGQAAVLLSLEALRVARGCLSRLHIVTTPSEHARFFSMVASGAPNHGGRGQHMYILTCETLYVT